MAAIYAPLAADDGTPVVNVLGFNDIPVGLDDLQHHGSPAGWWHA